MARSFTPMVLFFGAVILLVSMLLLNGANADSTSEKRALIIVSEFDGTNSFEVGKAYAYYQHLIGEGFDENNIDLLCMSNISGKDGDSTVTNVEQSFKDLVNSSGNKDEVRIYVSDNQHIINSETHYQFTDGQLSCMKVIRWVEEMKYSSLQYFNLGNHSGLFGNELQGPKNVVISSMREYQETIIDRFNITRGYNDPSADCDFDGIVTVQEAFYSEKRHLEGTDQDPIMW